MKAVALTRYLPIDHPESMLDVTLTKPTPQGRDLLVEIKAIAVNPVDTKVRAPKDKVEETPRVLGWDAAGIVQAIGPDVTQFKVGDKVFYAGDITRPGTNSEFQLVDERIVGTMAVSQSFEQAAALPLTAITAWEALFERLKVTTPPHAIPRKSILIIGGAGGVGSIAIQLAAKVAGLTVIATASRPESEKWVRALGAQYVISHYGDLQAQLKEQGFDSVDHVLILNDTDQHFPAAAAIIAPQGMICSIVENAAPLNLSLLKSKSAGFVWEFMFTRSMYQTPDMQEQGNLLNEIARLIDSKILVTTVGEVLTPINAANLRKAHAALETGRTIGKIVLKDF
ncbi:zinc-binding alcohol dehydrogenase family protein [Glaciimonas sp. PAMC28666]|uniref:zinc-binding alcohol dehydrogenase family protein n=1 Tax=Glaciimonas sp. PAMC28666 TaxID=2807626 RepID=UPI001962F424|nr:zinc-binding alcohol dehydrogenase family protein [Glaciimonas sp. PAMC28666]QRX82761.1 zinc-binding alcohol dehydrogenase family protein [Glaciimonas sp. PAMC28666]